MRSSPPSASTRSRARDEPRRVGAARPSSPPNGKLVAWRPRRSDLCRGACFAALARAGADEVDGGTSSSGGGCSRLTSTGKSSSAAARRLETTLERDRMQAARAPPTPRRAREPALGLLSGGERPNRRPRAQVGGRTVAQLGPSRRRRSSAAAPSPRRVRRRDASSSAACARASRWSRAFAAASRVARATASAMPGSLRISGSWTSIATGLESRSIGVTARPAPSDGRTKGSPSRSTQPSSAR